MMPRRRMILVLLLAATVVLSLQSLMWVPESDGSGGLSAIVEPVARASGATLQPLRLTSGNVRPTAGEPARQDGSLQIRARPQPARVPRDLFAAYSWLPPPAPATPSGTAAQAPEAPPLSFVYTGRIEVDGRSIFLLLQDERTLRVAIGQSVGDFTLTSSGPQGLVFLHQPTGLTRVLPAPGVPIASN